MDAPYPPAQFFGRWWGIIKRLTWLQELEAPSADIWAARRERNALAGEICDYYLVHWDSITEKERSVCDAMMNRLVLDNSFPGAE